MSIFVEKYLDWILGPLGLVVGILAKAGRYSYLEALPILSALALGVVLAKVTWRFALVLELNRLGYTVKKSGDGWTVDKPGHGISSPSLTGAVESARSHEVEQSVRKDERERVKREMASGAEV